MKTKICSAILSLITISAFSQVGIGTSTPTAMLDVNGTMKIRSIPTATSLTGYQLLLSNQGTGGDFQIAEITPQAFISSSVNASVFAAKKTTGITLLSLGIFPSGFQVVTFLQADGTVGTPALFTDTDHTYTVPSSGTYAIGFSFRYGSGLQASLLTTGTGIGILRTRAAVATLIDNCTFSGISVPLVLSLTISDSSINSLYPLQTGDKISFGLTGTSVIDAGVLGSSIGSFYIYKVSN
ncbi:hypothetical protein [Chryseobacterium polytrichastri]|uniref:C1q domain-containing protein n=1 Tax=Chryseobacterium polytrichastri TaxID=1302687 RepID=A0A1M6QSM3_9FLAO|nr:hypothetical protein [Chryseobacterium polytrichastri]SHK23110.1 hypothetical protein SAMN05444267_100276 [Chryseobacterium polytrichastri]